MIPLIKNQDLFCPVCRGVSSLLDVVDFNKSCEEGNGNFLPLSGYPVYYAICNQCGFTFTPEMMQWTLGQFEQDVYNADYIKVDPDYLQNRPKANAETLISAFGDRAHLFSHLDYGGGNGLLSQHLREAQFTSASYDPFVNPETAIDTLGTFDLITAFEVFEHVPDVQQLMRNLVKLRASNGLVLFSTLLSDGNIHPKQRLGWWYASPRNGHISLFSRHSLFILAEQYGLKFGSFAEDLHVFYTSVPAWADHIIQTQ